MHQLKINKQITRRDENSVNLYLQEVSRYPLVSAEEEVELAIKIRKGDEMAKHKLVKANLRFVISVAKQYQNKGISFIDLINEGNMGLVIAAGRFDETRGFKFISYAVWWIRQSIIQAIAEQTRTVRLPINRLSYINKISKATSFLEQKYEREPTTTELSEYLEINEKSIETNNIIKHFQISFDKPMFREDESNITLYDLVQVENTPSPDYKLVMESTKIDLERAIKRLSKRESDILTFSYGLNNHRVYSLIEIADLLNITTERVRQIKNSSLLKLKNLLLGKTLFQNNM